MGQVKELFEKVQRANMTEMAMEVIKETAQDIADLNLEQMYAGKDSEGQDISPFYTPTTIRIKKEKGQPFDRVTLHDLGNFYAAERVEVHGTQFTLTNNDPKAEKLSGKYGPQIHGLTPENKALYARKFFLPKLMHRIEQATGLKPSTAV